MAKNHYRDGDRPTRWKAERRVFAELSREAPVVRDASQTNLNRNVWMAESGGPASMQRWIDHAPQS